MRTKKLQGVVTRAKHTFDGFTNGQRAVTIIAVVVAMIGGVFFFNWASQPALSPLYTTALSQQDAGAITASLKEKGIEYELNDTTILVPRELVDQTRLDLAAEGLPAQTDQNTGYSLVEDAPLTTSDAQQRILVKRATEGELVKAMKKMENVSDATVQLALPEPDVFTREQAKTTASVLLTPKANQELSASQVEAVVHLVSSSIPKLDPQDVTVTDSNGKLLSAPGAAGSSGVSEARVAQQAAFGAQISQSVQTMLDKAVGAGNSSIAVRADLAYDTTKIQSNEYIQPPANGAPLQTDTSRENYTGNGQTPVGGVLGPDNIPVPSTNAGASAGSNYTKTNEKSINAVGTRTTVTDVAQGQPKRISVSVMIDAKSAGAINQGQLTQALSVAAGLDPQRDQISLVVLPFDTTAAQAQAAEEKAMAEQDQQDELITLAKNVGLGLLLLLALLIGFRQSHKKARTLDLGDLQSVEGGLPPELPSGATAAIEAPPAQYQLDDDDMPMLEATPVDPQSRARVEARQEITALVEDNPEEVARLLRGWMVERK